MASGEADCYLTSNYQYNSLRRECEKYSLTLLALGKEADFSIAVSKNSRELYSILARTTSFISDASMNAALTYYTAEGAKLSLTDLILDYLPVVIGAAIVIAAMILTLIFQHKMIVSQKKASESQRMVEDLNKQIFTDALTHVKNKGGFDKYIQQMQEQLDRNETAEVAIGVFDCNDLKLINDRYGHDKGNDYLTKACSLICRVFKHSPVFRIGGDEFTVVLQHEDYRNREELVRQFEIAQGEQSASAVNRWEQISVATGISSYDPHTDDSLSDTFRRADKVMYENKRLRKQSGYV
ncbi:MAG: GGDEF domain-containing protein [Clostridia bacterium]|nr:GGDEF domain-containing protein [Clostridia bacterium]